MAVPVSWVLAQADLGLQLRGGAAGVRREITLVLTTELARPFEWLSGGELVLTTGIRLPDTTAQRRTYVRGFAECDVAGLGFGTGLTHDAVPAGLAAAADEIGLPLIEVPLRTPFAAVVKRVTSRLAELQYDAVLRASRAQPRMTRAVVNGGVPAIVRELARSLSAKVLILDDAGGVVQSHPKSLDKSLLDGVRDAVASGGAASSVTVVAGGAAITHQRISVGRKSYGILVVVSRSPLGHADQILLGHANSLLALDYEKPARLQAAQQTLNSNALALLLSGESDLSPAWAHLASAADGRGQIRAIVVDCDNAAALRSVRAAVADVVNAAGLPVFVHTEERRAIGVLPGGEGADLARRAASQLDNATRKRIRLGLSADHPVGDLVAAVGNARLAASVAERGGVAAEFAALTGRALLSFDASREILNAVADATLTPIRDYDTAHGSELMPSLRAFLEANGHWESAAAALGVHRHTLRKRIVTAQALLGCDLDTARVRAELLLAMLAQGS